MEIGWSSSDSQFNLSPQERTLANSILTAFFSNPAQSKQLAESDGAKELRKLLQAHCTKHSLDLPPDSAERIMRVCLLTTFGLAGIEHLLTEETEEICITGAGRPVKRYSREKGWEDTPLVIEEEGFLLNIINRLARPLNRTISPSRPRLSATLPNGCRLHAVTPPASREVSLNIRRLPATPLSLAKLVQLETLTPKEAALLWSAVETDCNILLSGNTGSGKTTTLNSLTAFLNPSRRIITIEDIPEMTFPLHEHVVRLLSNEQIGIEISDLVLDTLRMRPDNVIIGEIRSPTETNAFMNSLTAGQAKATWATFHAEDGKQAINRLTRLGARETELESIDLIVVQRRSTVFKNELELEKRRVTQIRQPFSEKDPTGHILSKLSEAHGVSLKQAKQLLTTKSIVMRELAQQGAAYGEVAAKAQSSNTPLALLSNGAGE